jgi:L-ascorbate metabolism protein UlaG (beta-lactamase superfamily)
MHKKIWIARISAIFLATALAGCAAYYAGAPSPHYDGSRFFNPAPMPERGFTDFLRWQFTREPAAWPERIVNPPLGKPPARVDGDAMLMTMIGHASVLIQSGGLNVVTDPVWSDKVGPLGLVGPTRRRAPGVAFADLPKIDAVVVSHNHYDHMDLPSLRMLWERDRPKIVVPLGNDTILRDNIPGIEPIAVDWGNNVDLGGGARIIAAPVQHWSQRGPFDRDKALWAGYLIDLPGGLIYFTGDTGLGTGWWVDETLKLAPRRIDVALLAIGSYLPRWFMTPAHIDPPEAIGIYRKFDARAALGIHWGTFPLGDDGPEQARDELVAAREQGGIPADAFRTLEPGEFWKVR